LQQLVIKLRNEPAATIAGADCRRQTLFFLRRHDGHVASLERLDDGRIDICSIDNVTWGFFEKFRPIAAKRYRILDETPSSPSLPFVTSVNTTESDAVAIAEALHEIMGDPQTADMRGILQLAALSVPDVAAYERLAEYEREAADLGFPELK
jgi:ABC-type phosphate/phosphonate transport system substrate-binding protein